VLRDRQGDIVGINVYSRLDQMPHSRLNDDPIARVWAEHLRRHPISPHQTALCYRRMLDRETGTGPSDVQAAAWLDIKRKYMEMRPNLRRLYSVISNLEDFGEVSMKLGFEILPDGPVSVDGVDYHLTVLDFGPSSVDGWLSWLVSSELGVEHDEDEFLDVAAHEVVVAGERTPLTPREFEVLHYLVERGGRPVTRYELLRDVWGYDTEVGSNVVEATIRSVRNKLGDRAAMVETLRGVGYRFDPERDPSTPDVPVPG
jgi:Transcriptional regulatory protein, C terminal